MKTYRIYQVDAFTRSRFYGNPAGVVSNADGLTEEQMQQIAREMNNSETAFILQSDSAEYDVEVRFFTPTMEVPICGHATIAAHYVRAIEGVAISGQVHQKTKAGILPVDIIREDNDYSIVMTQGEPYVGKPFETSVAEKITAALGIDEADLREDYRLQFRPQGIQK